MVPIVSIFNMRRAAAKPTTTFFLTAPRPFRVIDSQKRRFVFQSQCQYQPSGTIGSLARGSPADPSFFKPFFALLRLAKDEGLGTGLFGLFDPNGPDFSDFLFS